MDEARIANAKRAQAPRIPAPHRVAPNPYAARVLANVDDGTTVDSHALRAALERVPIERAGIDPKTAQAFLRMGLRRLGQVLALPRTT